MSNYIVYIHTSPSGKRYIGITSQSPERRWLGGSGYCKNEYFTRAIKKYGWENFKHEIVAQELTKEDAENLEQRLITQYKTTIKDCGYNIKSGGDSNGKHSIESRQLMSANRKGKGCGPRSVETRCKMRENHAGGAIPKKVQCIETGEVFESINMAARAVGINKKVISNCCREIPHYNTAGGYHWQFI